MTELRRFVDAQAPLYAQVVDELRAGRKQSHWMWFVFPQLKGLGRSTTAQFYGLDGAAEAASYWAHPVLGPRLKECVQLVLGTESSDARVIFGSPDDLKFCSCLTLFEHATSDTCFAAALDRFYGGQRDAATVALLGDAPPGRAPSA